MKVMKEKILELDKLLADELIQFNFKKKGNHKFKRNVNQCIQHISFVTTKVRGKDEVYINIYVGFTYPKLNETICFLKQEKYDKRWSTSNINMDSLVNLPNVYGFYINETTEFIPIVKDIMYNIEKYAFPFLDNCNTLEKYEKMLVNRDEKVRISTYTLERPEWNLLAISLLLHPHKCDGIIEEYYNDFEKELSLLENARQKIKEFNNNF